MKQLQAVNQSKNKKSKQTTLKVGSWKRKTITELKFSKETMNSQIDTTVKTINKTKQ